MKAVIPNIAGCLLNRDHLDFQLAKHTSCLALSGWRFVEGAVLALLHCQDRLMVLLQSQEVNPEAVWHRLLLGVVLELSSSVKEHLPQRLYLRFAFFSFEDSVETR